MLGNREFDRAQVRHLRRVQDSIGTSEARWRAFGFNRAELLVLLLRGFR